MRSKRGLRVFERYLSKNEKSPIDFRGQWDYLIR